LLASVSHPHILSIFDFGTTTELGLPFLVTEYIEAGDLRNRMTAAQPMPLGEVRSIIRQIGDALAFLHSRGILHRDLKPENILMPSPSLVKVGDFGIAVMQDKAGLLTQTVHGMGTVGYVSPEQQYGLKVDERTDEYSLAAICYELLTGRRPLGLFPPPSKVNRQLTRQIDSVVLRALAEEPKNRFKNVPEFVTAFDQALAASPRQSKFFAMALAGLLCTLLVCAAVVWISGRSAEPLVPIRQEPARYQPVAAGKNAIPARPRQLDRPPDPPPSAPEQSDDYKQLVKLRAYALWVARGRLPGDAGKEKNWSEAESQILDEVKARAYKLWEKQGRPTDQAGAAVRNENMRVAAALLLKETEEHYRLHPLD
jgi:serine/threonine protein kinase